MATVAELRQNIIDLLNDAALHPGKYVDYRIGNKTFKKSSIIKLWTQQLEALGKMEEGDVDFMTFDVDGVDAFGVDTAQYEL